MKVMNLDLSKAQEMVPMWEDMTVSMKALYLGWPQVKNSDPYLVSMLVLMKEEYLVPRKFEKKALYLVQMLDEV